MVDPSPRRSRVEDRGGGVMTDDLIRRLRSEHGTLAGLIEAAHKAADRIEAQAAEIARLTDHLKDAQEIIQRQISWKTEAQNENERLREALEAYTEYCNICHGRGTIIEADDATGAILWNDCPGCTPARQALTKRGLQITARTEGEPSCEQDAPDDATSSDFGVDAATVLYASLINPEVPLANPIDALRTALAAAEIEGARKMREAAARYIQDNYPIDKQVLVPAIRNLDPATVIKGEEA